MNSVVLLMIQPGLIKRTRTYCISYKRKSCERREVQSFVKNELFTYIKRERNLFHKIP